MTAPDPFGPTPDDLLTARANWLGRYLDVEKGYSTKLSKVLSDAADSIDDAFGNLLDKTNISSAVRRTQLSLASKAIKGKIKDIFGENTSLIKSGQQEAAIAAVNAGLYDQSSVLASIFKNASDRTQYADSLRQTASRNIDTTLTRVLETEKPLSQTVYHSQALANGLVSQTVNRALAQGKSARELATDVKALINPSVPGGVSYAAMRLGRTEINNAFHAQSIHDAQNVPWIQQMQWNLSKTHKEQGCVCETYAAQRLFAIDSVPEKPHPNCRCFVTPVQQDYDSFENGLISGQFDSYLDSVMGKGTAGEIHASLSGEAQLKAAPPEAISPVGQVANQPQELKWNGPKMAKAIQDQGIAQWRDKQAVVSDMFNAWSSIGFDVEKNDMREGARLAQRYGYKGFSDGLEQEATQFSSNAQQFGDAAVEAAKKGTTKEEEMEAGLTGRSPELLEEYGKEIMSMIVHSPGLEGDETGTGVIRGISLKPEDVSKLVEGQEISMPLSSFSAFGGDYAQGFANGSNWVSRDRPKNGKPVLFELLPGAKTADMGDGELVSAGQFKIHNVSTDPDTGTTTVKLEHISLKEANVDKQASKADSGGTIPDIEFMEPPEEEPTGMSRPAKDLKKNKAAADHIANHLLPQARLSGFDNPALDPKVTQRIASALEPMVDKYPAAASKIQSLSIGDTGAGVYAYVQGGGYSRGLSHTLGQSSRMVVSDFFSSGYDGWKSLMDKNVADGFHPKGAEKDPVGSVITHEFGHVIQNMFTGQHKISSDDIKDALFEKHRETHPPEQRNLDNFQEWLGDQLSGYSFQVTDLKGSRPKLFQNIDVDEALSEAFQEVELGRGTDAEKALHKLIVDKYNENYGDY